MSPTPRHWAVGGSRDERIDGSPERGHVAKFRAHTGSYACVRCGAKCSDCGLFCDFHLWNLDHPTLWAVNHPE